MRGAAAPWINVRGAAAIAALGGLAFALASPPTNLYPLVVVGLALLGASLVGNEKAPALRVHVSVSRAAALGALWGTAASLVGLRFVPPVIQRFTPLGTVASWLALVLLALAQSLPWALAASVTSVLSRRARLPFEIALSAGVFAAVACPALFPWTPAGLVSPWPAFVQLADVIGERGVSALFALGAGLLVRGAWAYRREAPSGRGALEAALLPLVAAVALFGGLGLYGSRRIDAIERGTASRPTVRVGLIDPSIGPKERWKEENFASILRTLRQLSKAAEAQGAEITIWPETAYPYVLDHDAPRAPRGASAVNTGELKGPVLVGLVTRERPVLVPDVGLETDTYNSATLVLPDGTMQPSADKLELLAFGEAVPLGEQLPWLRRIFQRSGSLRPGREPRALTLPNKANVPARLAILNCYEDTLPGVGRRLARALAPNLLVNVTNDAWFMGTREPELHARLAVLRAVEERLDLVRAVNMGVASWVDAAGVVREQRAAGEPGAQLVAPALRPGDLTWYTRLGDAPLWVLFALSAAVQVFRRRRAR